MSGNLSDNYKFRIVTGSKGEECVEAHCETRSYFVLVDYFFKIPIAHLEFLQSVFQNVRAQLDPGDGQELIWDQYWMTMALSIRALQTCQVSRKSGGYALNEKSQSFVNCLFINAVYWYMENYTQKRLPPEGRSHQYFSYALFEATKVLDKRLDHPQVAQRLTEMTQIFNRLPVHITASYDETHPLVRDFSQNALYGMVASREARSAWMDPDSLDIKFYRLGRFFEVALLSPSLKDTDLLEPQKIAV